MVWHPESNGIKTAFCSIRLPAKRTRRGAIIAGHSRVEDPADLGHRGAERLLDADGALRACAVSADGLRAPWRARRLVPEAEHFAAVKHCAVNGLGRTCVPGSRSPRRPMAS